MQGFSISRFKALLGKDLQVLFLQLTGYVLIAFFLAVVAYSFTTILFNQRSAATTYAIAQAANLLLIVVPILTMRQFSRERQAGVLELIFSTSCTELEFVLAKYFSTLCLVSVMVGSCVCFPLALMIFTEVDLGVAFCGLFGLWLMAAALVAIGLCVASLIDNPLVAGIISLAIFVALWTVDVASYLLPAAIQNGVASLSFDLRLSRFMTGAIHLSDITFYLLVIVGALMLSVSRMSSR